MLLSCVKIVVARCWQISASGVNLFSCIYLWTEPSPVASHCIHCGFTAHVSMYTGSSLFTLQTPTMIVRLRCSMHKEIYCVSFISWCFSWLLVLHLICCYSILPIVLQLDLSALLSFTCSITKQSNILVYNGLRMYHTTTIGHVFLQVIHKCHGLIDHHLSISSNPSFK